MGKKFKAYWDRLCRATPQLNDPETKMKITVASLQEQLEKAFNEGRKHPIKTHKEAADEFAAVGRKPDIGDIFGGMFGNRSGGSK